MIQAMVCSLVFTSGAGTSFSGPMNSMISEVYRRVMRSSSPRLMALGSQMTPPLAQPKGIFTRAHFIERHLRRVADAALARAASDVVLHAKTRKHIDRAVIELHRKMHDDLA